MNEKPTYNYTKRIEQTFPCGCHIDEMLDGSYGITYCQKHAAAPELYEALKAVKDKITELGDNEDIQDAINKGLISIEYTPVLHNPFVVMERYQVDFELIKELRTMDNRGGIESLESFTRYPYQGVRPERMN